MTKKAPPQGFTEPAGCTAASVCNCQSDWRPCTIAGHARPVYLRASRLGAVDMLARPLPGFSASCRVHLQYFAGTLNPRCHNLIGDGELEPSPSPLPVRDFAEKVAGTSGCWRKTAKKLLCQVWRAQRYYSEKSKSHMLV
jgi:hypothetical protein